MVDPGEQKYARNGIIGSLHRWGEHSIPPAGLATLIASQHLRPFQTLPMIFPPALLFCSYLNLSGFETQAAGISAAWSGLFLLLARRRKQALTSKFTARGAVRGATMAMCLANVAGGGVAYAFGNLDQT